jgi:hypothetical protein
MTKPYYNYTSAPSQTHPLVTNSSSSDSNEPTTFTYKSSSTSDTITTTTTTTQPAAHYSVRITYNTPAAAPPAPTVVYPAVPIFPAPPAPSPLRIIPVFRAPAPSPPAVCCWRWR